MPRSLYGRLVRWYGGNRLIGSAFLYNRALSYVMAYVNGRSDDMAINGEGWLLDRLADFQIATIIDAGANRGDWTAAALEYIPSATIHSFEIAAPMARQLEARFAGEPRVVVIAKGLSDRHGVAEIRWLPDRPKMTTLNLLPGRNLEGTEILPAAVTTGQAYAVAQGMRVDFIKVDCEGYDLEVLRGFDDQLATIPVIQFEYNETSTERGISLRAFYEHLRGYEIGRLLRCGVDFRPYRISTDTNLPGNYVAVREDRNDIIEAIRWHR